MWVCNNYPKVNKLDLLNNSTLWTIFLTMGAPKFLSKSLQFQTKRISRLFMSLNTFKSMFIIKNSFEFENFNNKMLFLK